MSFKPMDFNRLLDERGFKRDIAGEEDYAAAVKACELAFNNPEKRRGIIIGGDYGVGKTCLAQAICALFTVAPFRLNLGLPSQSEKLGGAWQENYGENLYGQSVYLDDLGAEKPVNEYGVVTNYAAAFLMIYHYRGSGRLIITTNCNVNELDARYGGRVLSRLKDLCVPVRLKGKDKRIWEL